MPISSHSNCKFIPSCSDYMIECLNVYGVLKGLPKGIWRILRCNPFNKGGYDPVIKSKIVVDIYALKVHSLIKYSENI